MEEDLIFPLVMIAITTSLAGVIVYLAHLNRQTRKIVENVYRIMQEQRRLRGEVTADPLDDDPNDELPSSGVYR
jgi:heme exporter protein D